MAHRNAEIWAERHRRLEALKDSWLRHFGHAARILTGDESALDGVSERKAEWLAKYHDIERRVWHALCVAEGWRKA